MAILNARNWLIVYEDFRYRNLVFKAKIIFVLNAYIHEININPASRSAEYWVTAERTMIPSKNLHVIFEKVKLKFDNK